MLRDFYKYVGLIDREGISPELLAEIITAHGALRNTVWTSYLRYIQDPEATPIMTREFEGKAASRINNRIPNDYFGEIVDTKTGYMFGQPMQINYDTTAPGYKEIEEEIRRFRKVNNLDDFNAETCKFSSMCGYDAALLYLDGKGETKLIRMDPWETVILTETNITEPKYGFIYYKVDDEKVRVEFYDDQSERTFEGPDYDNLTEVEGGSTPHPFDGCPLVGIPNNNELMGDGAKVFPIIDAVNGAVSNMADEWEQFRSAYLLFIGYEPEEEMIESMLKMGALYIPDASDGEKIEWLTKTLDPKFAESLIDRLEANLTRFSKHVDFTDAAFGSDITGPAMRFKLFGLETKAMYFERKHQAAMHHIFKLLGSLWRIRALPFDENKLEYVYARNIPANLLDEAQTAIALSAITSKETALSALSVVKNARAEMERMEEEKTRMPGVDLDNLDNPTDNKDEKKDIETAQSEV